MGTLPESAVELLERISWLITAVQRYLPRTSARCRHPFPAATSSNLAGAALPVPGGETPGRLPPLPAKPRRRCRPSCAGAFTGAARKETATILLKLPPPFLLFSALSCRSSPQPGRGQGRLRQHNARTRTNRRKQDCETAFPLTAGAARCRPGTRSRSSLARKKGTGPLRIYRERGLSLFFLFCRREPAQGAWLFDCNEQGVLGASGSAEDKMRFPAFGSPVGGVCYLPASEFNPPAMDFVGNYPVLFRQILKFGDVDQL